MPPLQLSVGLGVIGRGPDVGHAGDSNEFFEVLGNKLRAIVADDSRAGLGELFPSALDNLFFSGTYSSEISAITACFLGELRRELGNLGLEPLLAARRAPGAFERGTPVLEELSLPVVEEAGLNAIFVAEIVPPALTRSCPGATRPYRALRALCLIAETLCSSGVIAEERAVLAELLGRQLSLRDCGAIAQNNVDP